MKIALAILLAVSIALNSAQRVYSLSLIDKMNHMADVEQVVALAREVERRCIEKTTHRLRFEYGIKCT